MTKRFAELTILMGLLVIAVALGLSTANYPEMVQGSTATYVRFLAMSLAFLCLVELVLWWRKKEKNKQKELGIAAVPQRFWGLLVLMLAYSLSLEHLGFYLTSALFLPITMVVLGARKWWLIGVVSAGVLLFIFLVFGKLLGVPLPEAGLF